MDSGNQIVSNGGDLWIFGFKTENMGATPFTVKNGGALEVLGGYCNQTNRPPPDRQNPLLLNDGGRVSATLFTNLGGPFVRAVVETRSGITTPIPNTNFGEIGSLIKTVQTSVATTIPNTDFPLRGSVYRSDYVIPLYVGDTRPTSPPAPVRQ